MMKMNSPCIHRMDGSKRPLIKLNHFLNIQKLCYGQQLLNAQQNKSEWES